MLFKCERCGKSANTALTRYWQREEGEKALCEDCDDKFREIKRKWKNVERRTEKAEAKKLRKIASDTESKDVKEYEIRNL